MKIIHCADLHLDSSMNSFLTKEQAKERKKEMLRSFTRMVDYAERYGVSVILIAGDLFDTYNVSAMARNMVRDAIEDHPDIDFLYLKGNHDQDNFLSLLEEIPKNLKLFSEAWTTYTYGPVTITGIELSERNLTTRYESLSLDPDRYNIVMMHGQLADYASKSSAEIIGLHELQNKNIDYLALGHLHTYQLGQIDARGNYCYPGCLEGRGFDECGQKGFVLLTVEEQHRTGAMKFVPAAQRRLHILKVDVSGIRSTQEAAKKMEQALAEKSYSKKSLVKFVLTGYVDLESEVNCEYLQDMFSEYFYYEKVVDRTRMAVDYKSYEKDASLKGEFIRMVLGAEELSEDTKSEMIRCGIMALSGEEL